jgi:hypothetical protein
MLARHARSSLWVVAVAAACGGGDDASDGATMPTSISAGDTAATGETPGSSDGASSSTGVADSSGGDSSSGGPGTTGGAADDPSYPSPGAGGCPGGTADVALPGAAACAPFCDGAGAMCPAPASGDAVATCTPFEMPGGSGTACAGDGECVAPEVCGLDGACISVAFWGCRLLCDGGQTCPDAMTCTSVGACGYE